VPTASQVRAAVGRIFVAVESGAPGSFRARTAEQLIEYARSFAGTLARGDVVAVRGALGAGKTTFVRGVVLGLHGSDPASSPTFTFWHRYDGDPPVNHLDLYRVEERGELAELGLEEALDPEAIVLIEWPERAPSLVPPRHIEVAISGCGGGPRELRVRHVER
jgi:tRNA threonylcarbamoyl adenosine modification protein YjeE